MTQTQTTAERIQALITAQYGQTVWRSPSNAATVAAAEIDALTTECDAAQAEVMKWRKELTLCNQERFDAQTQLAEARAEVRSLRQWANEMPRSSACACPPRRGRRIGRFGLRRLPIPTNETRQKHDFRLPLPQIAPPAPAPQRSRYDTTRCSNGLDEAIPHCRCVGGV